jgi:hypothetical protein
MSKIWKFWTANSLDDKILNTNPIAKSTSMVHKNLQGNHLQFPACLSDLVFVLIIPF